MTRRLAAWMVVLTVASAWAGLSPDTRKALDDSKYVYIQSERKTGALGRAAEIWFFVDGDAIYVGTRPDSWRVRRIKAGRKRARIAVGKADGPAFEAVGEVRRDSAVEERLLATFAKKYADGGWAKHADSFRDGFKSGQRVLVRYTPK